MRDFVYAASGITQTMNVLNRFSGLTLELYGEESRKHARSVGALPPRRWAFPVVVEAEVEIGGE